MLLVVLLLLVSATAAQAGHGGQVLFLADGDHGMIGDGTLLDAMPEEDAASVRSVLPTPASYEAVRFLWPLGEEHPDHLKGRMFAGLWLDQAPVLPGEVTVGLFAVGSSGMNELATASFEVGGNMPAVPDPGDLLPSDPTDPEAVVWHAMAQAYPLLQAPPHVADFGDVDVVLARGDRLAVGFRMADGSLAPSAALKYGAQLSPSFVFLPWHPPVPGDGGGPGADPGAGDPGAGDPGAGDPGAGDPGAGGPGAGDPGAGGPGTGGPGSGGPGAPGDPPDESTPAPVLLLVLVAIGLALRRRR